METSGLDRLLSYASELGGVRAARDRDGASRAQSNPAARTSRGLENDGIKLTLSSLHQPDASKPGADAPVPEPPARDSDVPREVGRPANARNRAVFSAYERVRASAPGERIQIKA